MPYHWHLSWGLYYCGIRLWQPSAPHNWWIGLGQLGPRPPSTPLYSTIILWSTHIEPRLILILRNFLLNVFYFSQNLVFNSTSCPPSVPLYLTIKLWSTRKKHFGVLDLILNEFDLAWEVLKYIFVMKSSQHLNLIGAHWCPLVPIGAQWGGTKRSILTPAGARWPPFGRTIWSQLFLINFNPTFLVNKTQIHTTGYIDSQGNHKAVSA